MEEGKMEEGKMEQAPRSFYSSLSNFTATIIASRTDLITDTHGPNKKGKFSGWITLGQADRFRPLVTSAYLFDSKDEAKLAMDNLIIEARAATKPNDKLDAMYRECCKELDEKEMASLMGMAST
jgi:hypothetical protein